MQQLHQKEFERTSSQRPMQSASQPKPEPAFDYPSLHALALFMEATMRELKLVRSVSILSQRHSHSHSASDYRYCIRRRSKNSPDKSIQHPCSNSTCTEDASGQPTSRRGQPTDGAESKRICVAARSCLVTRQTINGITCHAPDDTRRQDRTDHTSAYPGSRRDAARCRNCSYDHNSSLSNSPPVLFRRVPDVTCSLRDVRDRVPSHSPNGSTSFTGSSPAYS